MSGLRLGFAGSLLLHCGALGIWWTLAHTLPPSAKSGDRPLPVTLAMFEEVRSAPREPVSEPSRPPSASQKEARAAEAQQPPREVHRPVEAAPSADPVLAQGADAPPPKAQEKPAQQRRPKASATSVSRTTESPPAPTPAKRERRALPRLAERRDVVKAPATHAAPPSSAALRLRREADAAARAAKLEDEYLHRLWRALERSKFYPRRARRKGMQGSVQVRFRVLRDGSFEGLEVVSGSGSPLLDQAALQTVNKASGAVPFPDKLPKQVLVVSLPISYRWQ